MQNSSSSTSLQRKPLSRQSFSSNGDPPPSVGSLLAEDDSGQAPLPGRPVEQETNEILVEQQSSTYFKYKPVSTGENAAAEVKGPRRRLGVASLPTDCAAVLLSMAMIIFVCLVWKLDGSRVISNSYDSWENAITVLGTFFPILFASVVGRLMTEATRWNLEKGSTIGCLEQLMGSQTVGGSVLTILRLRSLSVLSPLLLLLWSFSPLGAQSLLRMTELRYSYREVQTTSVFFDTTAKSQPADWFRTTLGNTTYATVQTANAKLEAMKSLYTTIITGPGKIKSDTMDIWGNVKIPILKDMKGQEWQDVSSRNATVQYTSLVGVPINYVGDGNTSFHIESTYVHLECINATYYLYRGRLDPEPLPIEGEDIILASKFYPHNKTYSLSNGTWHGFAGSYIRSWSLALDRFVDPLWLGANDTQNSVSYPGFLSGRKDKMDRPILFLDELDVDAGPTSLLFTSKCQSNHNQRDGSFQSHCGVKQRYVESIIRCSGVTPKKECAVVQQRLSQKPHPSENISQLSFPGVFWTVVEGMPDDKDITYQSESSLYYIKDPSLESQLDKNVHFLQNVTKEDVSIRLTQLINTFLQLSQLYLNITTASEIDGKFEPNITVPATSKEEFLIVHVSKGWAVLSMVSSLVLLAASIVGVVFKHMARGPEALGYVSTALRDSRHVEFDSDSGRMDSIDLSRRMRNERIRLGVVAVGNDKQPILGIGHEKDTDKM